MKGVCQLSNLSYLVVWYMAVNVCSDMIYSELSAVALNGFYSIAGLHENTVIDL